MWAGQEDFRRKLLQRARTHASTNCAAAGLCRHAGPARAGSGEEALPPSESPSRSFAPPHHESGHLLRATNQAHAAEGLTVGPEGGERRKSEVSPSCQASPSQQERAAAWVSRLFYGWYTRRTFATCTLQIGHLKTRRSPRATSRIRPQHAAQTATWPQGLKACARAGRTGVREGAREEGGREVRRDPRTGRIIVHDGIFLWVQATRSRGWPPTHHFAHRAHARNALHRLRHAVVVGGVAGGTSGSGGFPRCGWRKLPHCLLQRRGGTAMGWPRYRHRWVALRRRGEARYATVPRLLRVVWLLWGRLLLLLLLLLLLSIREQRRPTSRRTRSRRRAGRVPVRHRDTRGHPGEPVCRG